jgi:hypothetical protein
MALLYIDGFDGYTDTTLRWTHTSSGVPTIGGSFARTGGGGMEVSSSPADRYVDVDSEANTAVFGFAWQHPASGFSGVTLIASLILETGSLVTVSLDASDQFEIDNNIGADSISSLTAIADTWYYIELKMVGSPIEDDQLIELYVDGVLVTSVSGTGTFTSGPPRISGMRLTNGYYDDLYFLDGSGTTNNDVLGPRIIETLYPDGTSTGNFTATGAGTNHGAVNETPADDDTSYVSSSTSTNQDIYTFDNMSTTLGQVNGVQMTTHARKDNPGSRTYQHIYKDGVPETNGATIYTSGSYQHNVEMQEQNPNTSADWTISEVNSSEFGYEVL